jgi:hypothetical protein
MLVYDGNGYNKVQMTEQQMKRHLDAKTIHYKKKMA